MQDANNRQRRFLEGATREHRLGKKVTQDIRLRYSCHPDVTEDSEAQILAAIYSYVLRIHDGKNLRQSEKDKGAGKR